MADTLHENKMRFAQLLQRYPKDQRSQYYSVVAKITLGNEAAELYPLYVIKIAQEWPIDDEVYAEIQRLDRMPVEKEIVMQELYQKANNKFYDGGIQKGFYDSLARIAGWITPDKNGPGTNAEVAKLQALFTAVQNPADT